MRALGLDLGGRDGAQVVCFGAHCDDIEIGCGGTLLRLRRAYPDADVRWVIFCSDATRAAEARASAAHFLGTGAAERVRIFDHRDGFLPYDGAAVKQRFEQLKRELSPDLILTHYARDAHQDHRLVSELTWNTFRDHLILEYEIPKYDGDLSAPNTFVALSEDDVKQKVDALLAAYASQRTRAWFDADTFRALMRLRGVECQSRFAEAFYSRKLVVEPWASRC
jgi:LmbE family N-acetylglucosaminyl deacetylase